MSARLPHGTRVPVSAPVTALVGPVDLRLYPFSEVHSGADDYDERPWKWWAMVRIAFRIGELTTTKRVVQAYSWRTPLGWARPERPTDAELEVGRCTVLRNLHDQIARHGFEPPEFVVLESDHSSEQRRG